MQFEESLGFVREETTVDICPNWELYRKRYLVLDGLHVFCHLGGRYDVFPRSGKDYYYLLGDTGDATCSSDSLGPLIGP